MRPLLVTWTVTVTATATQRQLRHSPVSGRCRFLFAESKDWECPNVAIGLTIQLWREYHTWIYDNIYTLKCFRCFGCSWKTPQRTYFGRRGWFTSTRNWCGGWTPGRCARISGSSSRPFTGQSRLHSRPLEGSVVLCERVKTPSKRAEKTLCNAKGNLSANNTGSVVPSELFLQQLYLCLWKKGPVFEFLVSDKYPAHSLRSNCSYIYCPSTPKDVELCWRTF